jgi:hypothetical protein
MFVVNPIQQSTLVDLVFVDDFRAEIAPLWVRYSSKAFARRASRSAVGIRMIKGVF